MSQFEKEAHSFVIRMWRENQQDGTGEWRGWIEHTQSQQRTYFRKASEISPIVSRYLESQFSEGQFSEDRPNG
ncbi:MAG: hypothetical protein Kow0080_26630 [Candidatus Promineifilaceae bacterium]